MTSPSAGHQPARTIRMALATLRRNLHTPLLTLACLVGIPAISHLTAPVAVAQTAVTGAISGVVTDATGASVPGAKVTIVDTATSATQTVTTGPDGRYSISLFKPSLYKINANGAGLQSDSIQVTVLTGVQATHDTVLTALTTRQPGAIHAAIRQMRQRRGLNSPWAWASHIHVGA